MQRVDVRRRKDALSSIKLNKTVAPQLEGISDDVVLHDAETGEAIAAQVTMPMLNDVGRELARHLRFAKLPWTDPNGTLTKNERLSGIGANTIAVGYTAPNKMYKRYAAKLAPVHIEAKPTGDLLYKVVESLWTTFQDVLPEQAAAHEELTRSQLHADWLLQDTPFSSGIINDNAVLPYHKDAGNIKDAWSMMLVLRRDVDGGCLNVPEYDSTFAVPDLSGLFFCGQRLPHGVTPLIRRSRNAYRYSIVYYTKAMLRDCGSAADELRRAQLAATVRAAK
jgi:hypothetical protein